MSTLRVPGRGSWHGGQVLGARALQVASYDLACERAPLPVPRVYSRVASRHESSGRSAREALACGGALGAGGLVVHQLTVARVAQALGVDEHVWHHTPYGDKYVTVILDVTPVRERRGPSRLLDMVLGRSKGVFKTWLASQPHTWRSRIEIVAMDGFTGFKSAAAEELPGARAVMDPFHVVRLAGNALDECRRRTGQELHHRRGRATDPLYKARRMLHTRSYLLTPRQQHQLADLFASDCHVALEVTWGAYQNITWRLS